MNLHGLAKGLIGSVNKFQPLTVRISTGQTVGPGARQIPSYATPGSITASIAAGVMTVSAIASGVLQAGQGLADTGTLVPGSYILDQLSGPDGGLGTYQVWPNQDVASEAMTTALVVQGQVQPMTWKDLRQIDGLNLQGTPVKIFMSGQVEAIIRSRSKGGDLITSPSGQVWLIAQVLEGWHTAGWCSVCAILQNGS